MKHKSKWDQAKKAKNRCDEAMKNDGKEPARKYWKRIFGRQFPNKVVLEKSLSEQAFRNTEEHIENQFPISIQGSLVINCRVVQDGFRKGLLRNIPLLTIYKETKFILLSKSS